MSTIQFILNEPRNPQNIGAAARGMANFGFQNLVVVAPYEVAWQEIKSAVHADEVIHKAKKFENLKEALSETHLVIGTSAGSRRGEGARWIEFGKMRGLVKAALKKKKKIAILFGSEKSGLSNEDFAFCHYVTRIPTVEAVPSMNLSQAVTLIAYSLREESAGRHFSIPDQPTLPSNRVEQLVAQGLEAFDRAGLLKGWDLPRSEQRLRKSITRWNLQKTDVAMLHALFRWVIKNSHSMNKE